MKAPDEKSYQIRLHRNYIFCSLGARRKAQRKVRSWGNHAIRYNGGDLRNAMAPQDRNASEQRSDSPRVTF